MAAGSGYITYPELLALTETIQLQTQYPSAKHMLAIASDMYSKQQMCSASDLQPVYVRDKVTWQKLPHKR